MRILQQRHHNLARLSVAAPPLHPLRTHPQMLVTQFLSPLRRRPALRPVRPDVFTSPHIPDAHRHLPPPQNQAAKLSLGKQQTWPQKKARPGGRADFSLPILIISIVPTRPDTLGHNISPSETITYMKMCDFYLLTEMHAKSPL